jgi:hypothetical protein
VFDGFFGKGSGGGIKLKPLPNGCNMPRLRIMTGKFKGAYASSQSEIINLNVHNNHRAVNVSLRNQFYAV